MRNFLLLSCLLFFNIHLISAQWTNRYPHVDGYGHHVYLEGYELPVLNGGSMDPAPSPQNDRVVFSSKGWLWLLDLQTSEAKRITASGGSDSSPNWSPNGTEIVFVRDDSSDTEIVLLNLRTGLERILVDTEALDLDPIFSADGKFVYYASAVEGSFDIWRINPVSMEKEQLTKESSLERLPIPIGLSKDFIYLKKEGFSYDSIELLNTKEGTSIALASENFTSQASFSLSPDNKTLAYTWPNGDDYEIRLLNIKIPISNLLLTKSEGLPLVPKFSVDGQWLYYAEYDTDEHSQLKRISINGGSPETIKIKYWNWATPTGRIKINSFVDGKQEPVRLNIVNQQGHPIIPSTGVVHSEGQHGMVFFYSPGTIEIETPLEELTITAVHGFSTTKVVRKIKLTEGTQETNLNLNRIWDANAKGWYSGDNHFHLNYGGTNQLDPEDILLDIKAEDLDIAFPLVANLGNRFLEQDLMGWKNEGSPIVQFGQEVRSHFLGHLGLIGTKEAYWPWIWGPDYDVYGTDDRLNADPLRFAHSKNALGGYVHPVSIRNPFAENGRRRVPISLIADAVLGEADYIELACLWTDEIGTGAVWHALLNTGIPLGISAGSDVMNDLYRTMAIGATRIYVKPKGALTVPSYLEAIKTGKSFATNGPLLEFTVADKDIGEVIQTKRNRVSWNLNVHSPLPYDKIEIFVNGIVVANKEAKQEVGTQNFKGSVKVPQGGWVTARVSGGATTWPLLDSYPFAESSPIWFHHRGSINPNSAQQSANELLEVLKVSTLRMKTGYGDHPIPNLIGHFEKAKLKLEEIAKNNEN